MLHSLKFPPLLKPLLSLACAVTILQQAGAEEPLAASLDKWAADKSIAEKDESFSLELPASPGEALTLRFAFPSRAPSDPPQVRAIFDDSPFAAFVPEDGTPVVLRLEIKGDNPGRHVRLRLTDANSEVFDTKPLVVEGDYTTLEFPLESFIEAHWDGDENGRIDWPLKRVRIETVDWAGASPSQPETISIRSLTGTSGK